MPDERKISVCIPTWERVEMTVESFSKVYHDERVGEVVIVDDCSHPDTFNRLKAIVSGMPKVKLYRNESNVDCYRNKAIAISYATNEYCIPLDSDNEITPDYLDKIFMYEWRRDHILQPAFAWPNFNFAEFANLYVTKENVADSLARYKMFSTMLNAMNYFVHAGEYIRVRKDNVNPNTADSIYQALNWLEAGNTIYVVPGLEYNHRVHNGSHYQINKHKTGNFYHEVEQRLRQLV